MMKTFWSRIAELWCTLMHPAPMWLSHGCYRCPVCLHTHPVPWEGARSTVAVQPRAGTVRPRPTGEGIARPAHSNAIADWTGVVVTVIATKYFYEIGSAESKQPGRRFQNHLFEWVRDHSLTIFLALTGAGWIVIYLRTDSESKWGQVIGNIVSANRRFSQPERWSLHGFGCFGKRSRRSGRFPHTPALWFGQHF
jgi:hypothetical protein